MKYYVVYERAADGGWGAYPPDLPGVGLVADIRDEARESVRKAIAMRLKGYARGRRVDSRTLRRVRGSRLTWMFAATILALREHDRIFEAISRD